VTSVRSRMLVVLVAALAPVGLHGCLRGCSSSEPPVLINWSMFNQPKYKAQAKSDFFYDGKTMRQPVAGTVARGHLVEDLTLVTGMDGDGKPVAHAPVAPDEKVVARGAERYGIYCQPCHDERGEGKGILSERAKVPTANLMDKRIVEMPDGQIFDTITNGKGLMASYRYPVVAADRWAIIAYVRTMQKKNADQQMEAAK
jgi:mono/diheme cytochrome c family protein